MLLSIRDMDALRLLCWCQYIREDDLYEIFTETELWNLMCIGFIKRYEKSGAFILTGKGLAFLKEVSAGILPELSQSYHKSAIQRRLRLSRMALTAYRAGVHPFTTAPSDLDAAPTLFLSAITRSRGSNPWGSTRIAAISRLGDVLYAMHYVCPGVGKLALTDELSAFSNQTARFHNVGRAVLFAGDSYMDVLSELSEVAEDSESKLIGYGDAYRILQLPVHILSCDDAGAKQLRVMATPNYRQRLAMAALKNLYQAPPRDAPAWDAIFQGMPFVMAADMNLRRVDAAIKTAQERGCPQIALAALEEQAESVLFSRYRDTGRARVFILTAEALTEALGEPLQFYSPSRKQFLTEEGDVVDAPLIQAGRKAGRSR